MEKKISSTPIYLGKVISVKKDEVKTETGRITFREVVHRDDTVSVLPIDENGMAFLVRQYRYAVGAYSLEIPAGGVDEGETLYDAARRKLREETGYTCDLLEPLISYHPAAGYCDEKMTVFLATGLRYSPLLGDEDCIYLEKIPVRKLYEDIMVGQTPFFDGKSNLAVMLACLRSRKWNGC